MMSFIKIALRNIPRRKLRNVLTIIVIALGVALFVGTNIATDSTLEEFKKYTEQCWGETDIVVTYGSPGLTFDEENLLFVQNVDGIDKAIPRLELSAFINGDPGKMIGATGVDPETDYEYESYKDLISGDWNVSENNVVATQALCDNFDLKIGDTLNVTIQENSYNLKIIGIFEPTERIRLTQLYFIMELDHLQSISDLEGQINSIYAKVSDIERTEEIKEKLQESFGPEFEVITPKIDATNRIKSQTESFRYGLDSMVIAALVVCAFLVFNTMLITVRERTYEIGVLRAMGSSSFRIFYMFLSESLLLGVVGVSLGIIGGLALSWVFIELLKAVVSGAPAMILPAFPEIISFVLTPTIVQRGILAGLITVIAGALYPAISACKISVDQALRPSMRFGRRGISMSFYFAAGVMLFTFGAIQYLDILPFRIPPFDIFSLLLGAITISAVALRKFSTTISKYLSRSRGLGMLVSRNVGRKILRNTVCFGVIGITLSFIIMTGGIKAGVVEAMELGVQESFGVDIILMPDQSLPQTFTENLTNLDNVESAAAVSLVLQGTKCLEPENKSIGVIVIDPETYPDLIQYDFIDPQSPDEAYQKLMEDNETLILPKALATDLGVSVGDNLTLQTWIMVDNVKENDVTDYTVAGIFRGTILQHVWIAGHPMSESIIIPFSSETEHFYSMWGEGRAWSFFVNVKPGAKPAEVLNQIEDNYPQYGFGINSMTSDDILEGARGHIDRIFFTLFSALYFSVIIATIGIAIAMVMNVIERKREIGILRSQGVSRGQMLLMFLGEAIVIGLIGLAIGIPCGAIILNGVTATMAFDGLLIRTILPLEIMIQALILGIAAAIGGALYPAYKASKMTIIESLRQK